MPSLSPFQTLPYHVVEMVVDYISGRSPGILYDEGNNSKEGIASHMDLLWVCHNFRVVAHLRHFRVLNLQLLDKTNIVNTSQPLAGRINYTTHMKTALAELQLDSVRNLVHINCSCFSESSEALQLARQSASTLQFLSIKMQQMTDISGLIHDSDGRYADYPCLHTLKLECLRGLRSLQRPVFGGEPLFPQLRRLVVETDYPFGDDTLFRGNAATLEYLCIMIDPEILGMFKEYNVFTPTSHPKLRCANVGNIHSLVPSHFATSAEYVQFVLGIAPKLASLVIYIRLSNPELQPVLSLLGSYTSVQVLRLPLTNVCLWDALSLLKSLPLLKHLQVMKLAIGPMPAGVNVDMLPTYVSSTFKSAYKRFRNWSFDYYGNAPSKDIITCVLLLALVCPNFDHPVLEYRLHGSFMAQMKMAHASRGYEHYSSRLRHLLYGK
ncbi:hypothetical protein GGI06_000348 [Coemansia sp. S85]|nr:hypothetical protein GGI06_000348 [Coemansia sp. S85]